MTVLLTVRMISWLRRSKCKDYIDEVNEQEMEALSLAPISMYLYYIYCIK